MNSKKGSILWAIGEMKKGKFVRCKDWIKGLFYFTQCKELIGENPNGRLFLINIGEAKDIDLNRVNLRPSEVVAVFTNDFENDIWISKNIKVKGGRK